MPFSPADYDLWARSTGRKYPSTPAERAAVAGEVHDFVRNFGKGTPTPGASRVGGNITYDEPVSVRNYDDNSVFQAPVTPDNNIPKVAGVNNNTLTGEQFENQNQDNANDNARRDSVLRTLGKVAAGAGLVAGGIALARSPLGQQALSSAGETLGQGYENISNRVSSFLGGLGVRRGTDLDSVAASGDVTPPTTAQNFNQQVVPDQVQAIQQAKGSQVGTPEKNLVPTVTSAIEDPWYSNVKPVTESQKIVTSQNFRPAGAAMGATTPDPWTEKLLPSIASSRKEQAISNVLSKRPIADNEPEYIPRKQYEGGSYALRQYEKEYDPASPELVAARQANLYGGPNPLAGKPLVDPFTGEIRNPELSVPGYSEALSSQPTGTAPVALVDNDVVDQILQKFRPDYESLKRLETGRETQAEMRRQQSIVDQSEAFMDRLISDIRNEPAVGISEQTSELNPVANEPVSRGYYSQPTIPGLVPFYAKGTRTFGAGEPTLEGVPYSILAGQTEKRDVTPSFYDLEGRTNKIVKLPSAFDVIPSPATAFTSSSDTANEAWEKAYGTPDYFGEAYAAGTNKFSQKQQYLPKKYLTVEEGGYQAAPGQTGAEETGNISERVRNFLKGGLNLNPVYPNAKNYDFQDPSQVEAYEQAKQDFYATKARKTALDIYAGTGDIGALADIEKGALPLNIQLPGDITIPTKEYFQAFGERVNPTTGISPIDTAEERLLTSQLIQSKLRKRVTENVREATGDPSIIIPSGRQIKQLPSERKNIWFTTAEGKGVDFLKALDEQALREKGLNPYTKNPSFEKAYEPGETSTLASALGALSTIKRDVDARKQKYEREKLFPLSYVLKDQARLGTYLGPTGFIADPNAPGGAAPIGVRLITEQEAIPTGELFNIRSRSGVGRQQIGNVGRLTEKLAGEEFPLSTTSGSGSQVLTDFDQADFVRDTDTNQLIHIDDVGAGQLHLGMATGKYKPVSGLSVEPQRLLQGYFGRTFKGVDPGTIDPRSFSSSGQQLLEEMSSENYDPSTGLYYSKQAMEKPTGPGTIKYDAKTNTLYRYNKEGQLTGVQKPVPGAEEQVRTAEEIRRAVLSGEMPTQLAHALEQQVPARTSKAVPAELTPTEAARQARFETDLARLKAQEQTGGTVSKPKAALASYIQRSLPISYESKYSPADVEANELAAYMARKGKPMLEEALWRKETPTTQLSLPVSYPANAGTSIPMKVMENVQSRRLRDKEVQAERSRKEAEINRSSKIERGGQMRFF